MSRHYHDADCVASALEYLTDEQLPALIDALERIAGAIAPTQAQLAAQAEAKKVKDSDLAALTKKFLGIR